MTTAMQDRARAVWAMGDYAAIAAEVIPGLGARLVEALHLQPGERVLDVAAGTGNATAPAVAAGAVVTAQDLCPDLVAVGRVEVPGATWDEGDAEALPYADGAFDVTMSCVGVMFAPHHEAAAAELVRVTRSGGRIGVLSWTPEGFIGQLFATLRPYVPAPPAGVTPPPRWGDEAHVRELLGEGVRDVVATRATWSATALRDAADFVRVFSRTYGPLVAAYAGLDHEQAAGLDADLTALARRFGADERPMDWEYLVVTAERV